VIKEEDNDVDLQDHLHIENRSDNEERADFPSLNDVDTENDPQDSKTYSPLAEDAGMDDQVEDEKPYYSISEDVETEDEQAHTPSTKDAQKEDDWGDEQSDDSSTGAVQTENNNGTAGSPVTESIADPNSVPANPPSAVSMLLKQMNGGVCHCGRCTTPFI
jgi:uncharacterized membrane protein YvbJ